MLLPVIFAILAFAGGLIVLAFMARNLFGRVKSLGGAVKTASERLAEAASRLEPPGSKPPAA